jgi:5-hydroxyisourate hydrolase / 2-oxo-4-hydroxy-4-carboxy-5-ureidoimidazoline decarboxylase
MDLKKFNSQSPAEASAILSTACGASEWVKLMMENFPFASEMQMMHAANDNWYNGCSEIDWLEAFTHHPEIGDLSQLEKKFASTKDLAGKEQEGVAKDDHGVIEQLLLANQAYKKKFGFIFIVYATGKSGREMLALLNDRLNNSREDELAIAMGEQQKITMTRLRKILSEADWQGMPVSQLTTHVLDTSAGKPAKNIKATLLGLANKQWKIISLGRTNTDGRISDLLPAGKFLDPGEYKIIFDTASYFESLGLYSFYPRVEIAFIVADREHYHVPLLLNPFGYSTYRGS